MLLGWWSFQKNKSRMSSSCWQPFCMLAIWSSSRLEGLKSVMVIVSKNLKFSLVFLRLLMAEIFQSDALFMICINILFFLGNLCFGNDLHCSCSQTWYENAVYWMRTGSQQGVRMKWGTNSLATHSFDIYICAFAISFIFFFFIFT